MKYEEFDPKIQKDLSHIMEKARIKRLEQREDYEKFILTLVDSYLANETLLKDLPYFFGWLELLFDEKFDTNLGVDKLYTILYMGSDMDWGGINKLTLQEILGYADELREKYKKN